ncbi:flagellar hook-basal body protein [Sedimentibacter sp. MB31-C6]|uniref:flagellar hook-basal body protein n=1 Tax=Sedimentibacter sp. MB31-C6 TaxID=3109366 RepID=UPI002DDC9355|nr:flagellar hook-basal body protein [Sedimentibacter sp. MB36-C1]WSI04974.1 flagellar hook-basal body protein [Sedimentibacter sp. MB36-C1]
MIKAFYTGVNGANSNQNYLDVISNNMSNIQTTGYKKSKSEFSDLMYTNIRGVQGENTQLKSGSGSRLEKIDILFNQGAPYRTDSLTDFAINGDGFFAISYEDEIFFTRDGSFQVTNMDDGNYLMYQGGYVLDNNEEYILLENLEDEINVGVYEFTNNSDLQRSGDNLFQISNEDAEYNLSENSKIMRGYLEASTVEVSEEMVKLLQTQRAFQLNSSVIKTADEVEQTINSLKG